MMTADDAEEIRAQESSGWPATYLASSDPVRRVCVSLSGTQKSLVVTREFRSHARFRSDVRVALVGGALGRDIEQSDAEAADAHQ